ncbi:calcium-binding protein [Sphingomonas sp.]|jgi:Ca2+-binding RTX toxin-like protein|uniref:calcium-binding protein n=1 Tax=Sphingomonas sp. TaxID=28214 RepID=UPI002DF6F2AA|nr:calcium-binding protein [Sphingomonas sp.]
MAQIDGTSGNDVLNGTGADDIIRGFAGNDVINGEGGNDQMFGGLGDDIFYVNALADLISEAVGEGQDRVVAFASYALAADAEVETLETVTLTDTTIINLTGNGFANTVFGNFGANRLDGAGGADTLHGFAGNDYIVGGAGLDVMYGGAGNDSYYIDSDDGDRIFEEAGEGYDTISAEVNYTLPDSAEVERLEAGTLTATTALQLGGSNSDNLLIGNAGNNRLRGFAGNDTMQGLAGDDVLIGDEGDDVMYGGTGNDTYYVDTTGDRVFELTGEGNDRIATSVSITLPEDAEVETIEVVNLVSTNALNIGGSNTANMIVGNAGANVLRGFGGNDTLSGYLGDDTLIGDQGNDTMIGGAGNDVYIVDAAGDVVVEAAGQGTDRIAATASYTLGAGVSVETLETITSTALTAINLTGNELDNTIAGNNGVNILQGGAGNDVIAGYGGDDRIVGGTGNDTVDGGDGMDRYILSSNKPEGYKLTAITNGFTIQDIDLSDGDDGTDTVLNVEQFQFGGDVIDSAQIQSFQSGQSAASFEVLAQPAFDQALQMAFRAENFA